MRECAEWWEDLVVTYSLMNIQDEGIPMLKSICDSMYD